MSTDIEAITPRQPLRPLLWPDIVLDLQDQLADFEQPIYIIGGAVRDAWRHHPIHDLDLATPANAIQLARHIADLTGGDVFVMDRERDVARVLIQLQNQPDGNPRLVIDVAGFRANELLEDLRDRDFTINAMAVDLKGDPNQLIDPLNGEQDLADGRIRRCDATAITNDPIRALRAVRQSSQLNARIEPQTLADIRQSDLSSISAERLRDEWFKVLRVNRPWAALRVVGVLGLLDNIILEIAVLKEQPAAAPGLASAWDQALLTVEKLTGILNSISLKRSDTTAARFELGMVVMALDHYRHELLQHITQEWPEDRSHSSLLQLGALLLQSGSDQAGERATELRLSNDEKKRLAGMIRAVDVILALPTQLNDLQLHRFWYKHRIIGVDGCLLTLAHYLAVNANQFDQDDWIHLLEKIGLLLEAYFRRYDTIVSPPPVIDGNQLMAQLDLKPGKKIKTLLDHIRERQVLGEVTSLDDALQAAQDKLSQNGYGEKH